MADESNFLIQILLDAKDNASAKIAALTAEVEALKKAASGQGGPTAGVSKDLDETGKAARATGKDLKDTRTEHEKLRESSRKPEIKQSARDIEGVGAASRSATQQVKAHTVAVDDHRSATSRLGAGIRDTTTATKENEQAVKSAAQRAEEAAKSYEMFDVAVRKGGVGADDARRGYAQFSNEIGGLVRQLKAGSQEALRFSRISDEARSKSGDFGPSAAEINRVSNAYKDFDTRVKSGTMSASEARRGYKDLSSELGSVGRAFRAGSGEAEHFLGMAEKAGKKAKEAGYLAPGDWNWDNVIQKTAARFDDWGIKIVSLSANLRGLALASMVGLAQQLDTAVVGLAGGLVSVASAAAQAGAALGGALVSGISQAIPVLAVIGATVERLKSVFQAVGLANTLKTSEAAAPHKVEAAQLQNANAIQNAQHGLQNAYEGVATAQEHVRSSQEALTLARINAIRNLTDLTLAEKSAKLAAEGASLSLVDAQRALQQAVQQGNTAGIQGAQLNVEQAELGVTKANQAVPRAEQDAQRARRQGVEGNPSVVSARQGVVAARKAVSDQEFQIKQAQSALKLAQVQASEPGAGQPAQRTQLNQLEKNFTGPEKALFNSLKRISEMLKSPSSPLAKLSDYLVEPISKGVGKIASLLSNKSAMKPLDDLAKSMGGALTKVEETLTSTKSVSFFGEMAHQASTNIPLIAHAFDKLIEFFQSVAKTAAPFLHDIIKGFDKFATDLNTKFSSTSGLDKLREFFSKGEVYARDILHLAEAFGKLLFGLGKASAPTGDNLITSLTKSLNEASTWVSSHGPQVTHFFEQTGDVVKQLGKLLFGIGAAMISVFNPASTAAFQQVITQILLPALTKILNVLGWITTAVLNIAKAFPGGTVALQAIAGIALTLLGIGKLYEPLAKVWTIMKALRGAYEAFALAQGMGKITAAWEAFHSVMSKVKDTTKGAAGAQLELNAAESAGVGTATADAAAQSEVAAASAGGAGAAAAGGGAGLLSRAAGGVARFGLTRVLPSAAVLLGTQAVLPSGEGQKARGIPTTGSNFQRDIRQFNNEIGDIKHVDPVGFVKDFFGGSEVDKSQASLRKFGDELSKIKGNLSTLPRSKMLEINSEAVRLAQDPSLGKYKKHLEEIASATDPSLVATRKWSEKMKQYMESLGPAAADIAKTFESINESTGSILRQISEVVKTNSKKIAEDLGVHSKAGKDALIANFGGAVAAIQRAMEEGKVSTGKGMQDIGKLVAEALKVYGINPSAINKYVASVTPIISPSGQPTGSGLHKAGFAAGGWAPATPGGKVYEAGEANYDEVVLTTDPRHGKRQRGLLNEYIKRAPHVMESHATGGFVGDPGKDFSYGKEPQIVAALRKLGEMLHTTIYGISGHRTPAESVSVGGFANDPHTRGEAADIGVGSQMRDSAYKLTAAQLAKVGLYRPFFPADAKEVNHVQLLAGGTAAAVAAASKGAEKVAGVMASGYEIAVPKVKGLHGQMRRIAQGALNKVAKAASEYVTKTVGTLPAPELGPEGKPKSPASFPGVTGSGGSSSANEKLGKEMMLAAGWSAKEWPALQKLWTQESGWSSTAQNNPSGAWLGKDNASGIPQADNQGQVYAKGDAKGQIAWGLNYIKKRYGSPSKAWAFENSHSPAWYAQGGLIHQAMMAMGGKVASWGGRPVNIVAHEGERVMNPMQYAETARMAGTTPAGLDKHMGYDGRPKQSFEIGGLIPPRVIGSRAQPLSGSGASSLASASSGLQMLSNNPLSSNNAIVKVFKAVHDGFAALAKIEKKSGAMTNAVIPFINSLTNESTGVIARLQAGFTAMTSRLASTAAKANFKVIKSTAQSGRLVSSASPTEITDRTLKDLATERKNLQEQQKIIAEAEKQIQKRIKALSKKKQTSAVKKELQQLVAAYNSLITSQQTVEEETAQNLEAAAQASQQRVQNMVTEINNSIGLKGSELSAQQGAAQTLGNLEALPELDAKIAQNARDHIDALRGALQAAEQIGNQELVSSIKQEMIQLGQAVVTATAQMIQDAIAAVQQKAGLKTSEAARYQSFAQVFGAQGRYALSAGNAAAGYSTEIENQKNQKAELGKLLTQAQGEGNWTAYFQLKEALNGLEASILTNEQALRDNTAVMTQAYVAQISRQGQFATGVYGAIISFLKVAGEITGATDVAGEAKLYERSNESLRSTNKNLIGGEGGLNAFLASLGISIPNLEGLEGKSLVDAISHLDLKEIESHMDPAQQQAFEQLISSILGNTVQIEQNNKELAALNGSLTQLQTFTTTVGAKFRDAIFTGIGGLLPTYAEAAGVPPNTKNPGLTGAGSLETPVMPTEVAGSPHHSIEPRPYHIGEQNNYFTEPTEVLDPLNAGRKIAFSMKTPE